MITCFISQLNDTNKKKKLHNFYYLRNLKLEIQMTENFKATNMQVDEFKKTVLQGQLNPKPNERLF